MGEGQSSPSQADDQVLPRCDQSRSSQVDRHQLRMLQGAGGYRFAPQFNRDRPDRFICRQRVDHLLHGQFARQNIPAHELFVFPNPLLHRAPAGCRSPDAVKGLRTPARLEFKPLSAAIAA